MIGPIEFRAWPKTPRLFRDCVITEKLDGTNAAVGVEPITEDDWQDSRGRIVPGHAPGEPDYRVYAQSRKRIITPDADNYGFAAWVWEHADSLAYDLGPGLHFGEWWGRGIQRGYGLDERRFSLFNTAKWGGVEFATPGVDVVPVLYSGEFGTGKVNIALSVLRVQGSKAAPGWDRPEGVVIYHTAAGQCFKALIENDDQPKGSAAC